jgi:hypothetical protein
MGVGKKFRQGYGKKKTEFKETFSTLEYMGG